MQRREPYFTFRNHLSESYFFLFFTLFHIRLTCHYDLFNYPEMSNIAHATKRNQVYYLFDDFIKCNSLLRKWKFSYICNLYCTSIPNFMIRTIEFFINLFPEIILTFKFQLAWVVFWIRWKWLECGLSASVRWASLLCVRISQVGNHLNLEALRSRALSSNQLIAKFLS